MGSWFDRLLGREEKQTGAAPPTSPAPITQPVHAPPTPKRPPEPLTRAQIAETLALPLPLAAPVEPDAALVERVRSLFRQTSPVPGSPPQLALRILNIVSQPDADPAELAKLISHDASLTAAVLRVANSAAYRAIGRIDTVRDAITRIGMREVARVGCALSAKSVFDPQRRAEQALYGPLFLELFVHASATALAAAQLTLGVPKLKGRSELVFLGGLLHDLGKPVGLRLLAAIVSSEPSMVPLTPEQVHAILDAVHVDFGTQLHTEWRLPESSLAICQWHHANRPPESELFTELHAVRLTSALHLLRARPPSESRLLEVEESAQVLGVDQPRLAAFSEEIARFREMAQELGS